jgi:uncharacterized peroxidase-related enzyme
MFRIPLLTIETASAEAKPRLAAAEAANGYIPNLLALLANAPGALEAYLTLSGINAKIGLSLAERETVQITAAATHGCGFCVAGHTAIAVKKAGLPEAEVEALRSVGALADPRLDAVQTFTKAVIRSRGAVSDEELSAFKAAGFSDANALEVVLGVGLATICNFANNLGRPELNVQLEPYRWERPAALAAE